MKRQKYLPRLFCAAAILLLAGFCVGLGVDLAGYSPADSAPFSLFVLVRVLEFVLPGILALCVAGILRKKYGKEAGRSK